MHDQKKSYERHLLQQLQNGDENALGALMQLFYTDIYNYGCQFSGDEQLVKDCIQEVFISLWQRRETSIAILSLKYYLLRAVKNKVLKAILSTHKAICTSSFTGYDFKVEFSIESKLIEQQLTEENTARLRRIISHLSCRQKEIIYLKFYHQLDHDQIAALMNISSQSVYNLLYECLQKLRKCWRQELIT